MSEIRLIHLADIHLGFTGRQKLVLTEAEDKELAGRYVREVDIEKGLWRMTTAIIRAEPPVDIVVIAGDLFDKAVPRPRAISCAAKVIHELIEADIPVVIIDGNHETAKDIHIGSPTTFLRNLGAKTVNRADYQVFHDCWQDRSAAKQERLAKLAIHALPHEALGSRDLADVLPLPNYLNILLTHGADPNTPSPPYDRAHPIPEDLLRRGWDYIALGHVHRHRSQPFKDLPAFYAGSLEALYFHEGMKYPFYDNDPNAVHGALDVRFHQDQSIEILTFPHEETRPVLYLGAIDATSLDSDTLMKILRLRLHSHLPAHALVRLDVNNVRPQVWEQLDSAEVEHLKSFVRYCDLRRKPQPSSTQQEGEDLANVALVQQWIQFLAQKEHDPMERAWHQEEGIKYFASARHLLYDV